MEKERAALQLKTSYVDLTDKTDHVAQLRELAASVGAGLQEIPSTLQPKIVLDSAFSFVFFLYSFVLVLV